MASTGSRSPNGSGAVYLEKGKINVFLSSRITASVTYRGASKSFGVLRDEIRSEIEALEIFGERPFQVFISEQASVGSERNAVEQCRRLARECDIFIAVTNGEAGFAAEPGAGENGICHEELAAAYYDSPNKVYLIRLDAKNGEKTQVAPTLTAEQQMAAVRDVRFSQFIKDNARWVHEAADGDEVIQEVQKALVAAVVKLSKEGTSFGRSGARASTEALSWEQSTLSARKDLMTASASSVLRGVLGGKLENGRLTIRLGEFEVLCRVAAVPDALSYAPARDLVGQTFRNDHALDWSNCDPGLCGPVHVIVCHRGVTRTQARKLLGVEDATYIETPFGVFVADEVQQVQVFLIKDCRDDTSTRTNVTRCVEWLHQSGLIQAIGRRAMRRRRIVEVLREALGDAGAARPPETTAPPAERQSAKPNNSLPSGRGRGSRRG